VSERRDEFGPVYTPDEIEEMHKGIGRRLRGVVKIAKEMDEDDPDRLADKAWLIGTVSDVTAWFDMPGRGHTSHLEPRLEPGEPVSDTPTWVYYEGVPEETIRLGLALGLMRVVPENEKCAEFTEKGGAWFAEWLDAKIAEASKSDRSPE